MVNPMIPSRNCLSVSHYLALPVRLMVSGRSCCQKLCWPLSSLFEVFIFVTYGSMKHRYQLLLISSLLNYCLICHLIHRDHINFTNIIDQSEEQLLFLKIYLPKIDKLLRRLPPFPFAWRFHFCYFWFNEA